MSMQRSIEGLRATGDYDLAERQADIQAEFQRRHSDISDFSLKGRLPQEVGAQKLEAILSPLSAETQKLIERMKEDGYAIYETVGNSPAQTQADGMRFLYLNPALERVSATPSLLAFKPKPSEFFIRGSQNIPHEDQLKLLEDKKARVEKKYSDTGVILREGTLSEWIELSWKHFQATDRKVRLFGKDYGYSYTWTSTYMGAHRASFGRWYEADGADAYLWDPAYVGPSQGLASLVEILRK